MTTIKTIQLFLKKNWQSILVALLVSATLTGIFALAEADLSSPDDDLLEAAADFPTEEKLVSLQENSLIAMSNPSDPEPRTVRTIKMVITAYSSSPLETDSDPFLTAAGTWVKDGIVANNLLPFGTKIRIPEVYGDKIFVVEDRMHWRKGFYHLDIWFPSRWEALNFGAKNAYIEILES